MLRDYAAVSLPLPAAADETWQQTARNMVMTWAADVGLPLELAVRWADAQIQTSEARSASRYGAEFVEVWRQANNRLQLIAEEIRQLGYKPYYGPCCP